jgi:valyl-tRNA synthetase
MIMLGLHFMGDIPFRRVLLAGLLVDETGKKMSKVAGNVIDPMDLIHGASFDEVVQKASPGAPFEEAKAKFAKAYPSTANMGNGFPAYGTDAVRMMLTSYSPATKRIPLAPKRLEGYRNFCNKMWNTTRYALPYLEGVTASEGIPTATRLENRWILSRLSRALDASYQGLEEYRLDDTTHALYHFFWDELCDWYIELTKPVFQGADEAAKQETRLVLAHVLETMYRAIHPMAPYVTEELWQQLPRPASRPKSISVSPYPTAATDGRLDTEAESQMATLQAVIVAARTMRSEHGVPPNSQVPLIVRARNPQTEAFLRTQITPLVSLIKVSGEVLFQPPSENRPRGMLLDLAAETEVLIGLQGLIDPIKERARIDREIKKAEKDLQVLQKQLDNPQILAKAPPEVVEEKRAQRLQLEDRKKQLAAELIIIDELDDSTKS